LARSAWCRRGQARIARRTVSSTARP
jgi:hypothetical protein